MATVACELHVAFQYFHWTGFYRSMPLRTLGAAAAGAAAGGALGTGGGGGSSSGAAAGTTAAQAAGAGLLVVGPYQGSLGCLRIPFRWALGAAGWHPSRPARFNPACRRNLPQAQLACVWPPSPAARACAALRHAPAARSWCRMCTRSPGTLPAPAAPRRVSGTAVLARRWRCDGRMLAAARSGLPGVQGGAGCLQGRDPPSCAAPPPQSELVVPVLAPYGELLAVLDVDSGVYSLQPAGRSLARRLAGVLPAGRRCPPVAHGWAAVTRTSACAAAPLRADLPAAFTDVDVHWLERLCADLGARRWASGL